MGKVFKSNTWLLILDPEVQLWNEKLKRLRENEKKQTSTISIASGKYDTEIIIDLISQDFRVKYQESSIGFENLAYLQSIENECNNRSTQSRIDKLNRLLSLLFSSRVTVFQLCSFQLNFKGHAVAIMEFPAWVKIKWRDFTQSFASFVYKIKHIEAERYDLIPKNRSGFGAKM